MSSILTVETDHNPNSDSHPSHLHRVPQPQPDRLVLKLVLPDTDGVPARIRPPLLRPATPRDVPSRLRNFRDWFNPVRSSTILSSTHCWEDNRWCRRSWALCWDAYNCRICCLYQETSPLPVHSDQHVRRGFRGWTDSRWHLHGF